MSIICLIILALMGEAIWETGKMLWQNNKINIDRVGALVVSEVLAIGAGIDMFVLIGIPLRIPYVGMVLTGLLISRGANFMHDLLANVDKIKENNKQENVIDAKVTTETEQK